jgi:hypothetical protein
MVKALEEGKISRKERDGSLAGFIERDNLISYLK